MNFAEKILLESSLSRIFEHIEDYDIAIISGCRENNLNCLDKSPKVPQSSQIYNPKVPQSSQIYNPSSSENEEETKVYSKLENNRRSYILKGQLLELKYGVTAIDGNYIENFGTSDEKEVKEDSCFVVNINHDENFLKNIIKFGEDFCQDSVLLKPKGQDGYLYGTNHAPFPGFGEKKMQGTFKGGKTAEFLSKINGRPFVFEHFDLKNVMGKWWLKAVLKDELGRENI